MTTTVSVSIVILLLIVIVFLLSISVQLAWITRLILVIARKADYVAAQEVMGRND